MKTLVFKLTFILLTGLSVQSCLNNLLQRSIDGSCNNLLFSSWGKSGELFTVGQEGSDYDSEIYRPVPDPLPTYENIDDIPGDYETGNARTISHLLISDYDETLTDARNKSMFDVFFAQFVAHDLENNRFLNPEEASFEGDFVSYIHDRTDLACTRDGVYRCNDNDTVLTINGQKSEGIFLKDGTFRGVNNATAFLDLNVVYGDNDEVAQKLRTKSGGKLVTTKKRTFNVTMNDGDTIEYTVENFLPIYDDLQVPLDRLFVMFGGTNLAVVAGDHRVNVDMGVGLLHTLFVREHNRLCDELMNKNILWKLFPQVFDEVIYQKARHIVIAKYQKIVYDQFLPTLLGNERVQKLGTYNGYNMFVDPSIMTSFASGAFRYGHFIMKDFPGLDECAVVYKDGKPTDDESYRPEGLGGLNPIPDSLTHIGRLIDFGSYENIARGLISEIAMPMNFTISPFIRSLPTERGAFDLAALDIMRSRYNGVPKYVKLRKVYNPDAGDIYGKPDCPAYLEEEEDDDPVECFLHIISNETKALTLKQIYRKVYNVDGIVGMMLEEHDDSTTVGETIANIIINQFKRLRDGDRFYYESLIENGYFTRWEKDEILETTMGKLLRINFDGDEVDFPDNPFTTPENYKDNLKSRCQVN